MKKLILTVFMAASLYNAEAQSKFHPGLTFSPMFTWLSTQTSYPSTTVVNDGLKFGFCYGFMGDYMIANNYGISFEARIAQLTNEFTVSQPPLTDDEKLKMQLVQIPVSLKMKT